MALLEDVTVNEPLVARTRRRFDYFIPNYLQRHLRPSDAVVSIGCGIGHDVQLLCELGYDAFGLDPGVRSKIWETYPTSLRARLRVGFADDLPFGPERFDFAYALEYGRQCTVEALSSVGYPSHSGSSRPGNLRRSVSGIFLKFANVPLWRSSLLNPILVVLISKRKAPENIA